MEEKNQSPKKIDIGYVIDESISNYKKMAITAGFAFFGLLFVLIVMALIGLSSFADMETLSKEMKNFNPDTFTTKQTFTYLIAVVIITTLISPFVAGFLKMAQQADNNEEVTFSSVFYYINNPKYLTIISVSIIVTTLSVGIDSFLHFIIPLKIANILGPFFSYAISAFTFVSIPLVLFKNLTAIQAITKSIQFVSKNLVAVVALAIIAGIGSLVGLIAFCIGIFFTIPFVYAVQYSIFKQIDNS